MAAGDEGVVRQCTDMGIRLDTFRGNVDGWHDASMFELVASTGPVRTVTRKEIVPGVYGRVKVADYVPEHMSGNAAIHLADRCGKTGPASLHWLNATELRAAAVTFVELADALDEVAA